MGESKPKSAEGEATPWEGEPTPKGGVGSA